MVILSLLMNHLTLKLILNAKFTKRPFSLLLIMLIVGNLMQGNFPSKMDA